MVVPLTGSQDPRLPFYECSLIVVLSWCCSCSRNGIKNVDLLDCVSIRRNRCSSALNRDIYIATINVDTAINAKVAIHANGFTIMTESLLRDGRSLSRISKKNACLSTSVF